jgi:hypothetical protein
VFFLNFFPFPNERLKNYSFSEAGAAAALRLVNSVFKRAMSLRTFVMRVGFSIADTAWANYSLVRFAFSSPILATNSSVDSSMISEFFIFLICCNVFRVAMFSVTAF